MSEPMTDSQEENYIIDLIKCGVVDIKWGPNGVSVPDWIAWIDSVEGRRERITDVVRLPNKNAVKDWIERRLDK